MRRKTLSNVLGLGVGLSLSPLFGLGSWTRRARLFHPRGIVLEGQAEPLARYGPREELAARLAGPVLARFSGALFEQRESPDLLGCALRFHSRAFASLDAEPTDQDLLLATARSPLTLGVDFWTTRARDFLANRYHGMSPFEAPPLGSVYFRLVPLRTSVPAESREQRLLGALRERPIELMLEVRAAEHNAPYEPLLRIVLLGRVALDDRMMAFDPFRCGRGITPVGFVQNMRFAPYAVSARMRSMVPHGNGRSVRRVLRWRGDTRTRTTQ